CQLGDRVAATTPDADIAFVVSTPSKYALAFEPVFPDEGAGPHSRGYQRIFEAFYRGAFDAVLQAHVLHDRALPSGAELAERYRVLIVPGLYVATDALISTLREYVAAGGHLLLGPRSGYADEWAVVRRERQPGGLAALAGAGYQEFTTLRSPVPVVAAAGQAERAGSAGLEAPGTAATALGTAEGWAELLEPGDAEVLARYDHPELGTFAAATTATRGAGRVSLVGFVPDQDAAARLVCEAAERSGLHGFSSAVPSVTHSSATGPQERVHFYFNWSGESVAIRWPEGQTDAD